ncbi:MAG: 2-C-methyl-D-erythritol 2,4-cyclodiphosphate synthase [Clostridia bacterium]
MRIGHGYDVHKLVSNRTLVLGGVIIPHDFGLLGHSDADVLIHAIMDSIIGALAIGDIGKLFPDNDIEFEGISSMILLDKVYDEMNSRGYEISNIDATIVAQKPKLRKHIDLMRENISIHLKTSMDNINIKATTEENLGFTGNLEGISAHSVCLIKKII